MTTGWVQATGWVSASCSVQYFNTRPYLPLLLTSRFCPSVVFSVFDTYCAFKCKQLCIPVLDSSLCCCKLAMFEAMPSY